MRGKPVAMAAVIAAALALVVSACGGGGGGNNTTAQTTVQSSTAGKTFALLKVVDGTTDYLDPGLSYRAESWQLFQDVYLGLVVKAHVSCQTSNCTTILPGLATTTGTVTNGGKTYKFTLRKGLKYSDGTPVKASDFKNTIIRDFRLNSPGIGFFSNIAGSDACEGNPTKCNAISGIVTDDSTGGITINLKAPQSDFLYILSIPFTSLVPSSTPQKDTENPPPAANGPYYFASYSPSKQIVMKRNPNWKKGAIPAVPDGNPDKIVATLTDDQAQSAQLVASGQAMWDGNLLPTDRLSFYKSKYGKQINFFTTPSTYYFFMNQRTPPFDNLKARQAVNYAINRQALVNLRGGLGVPTYNFLPPSYPQYKKITPDPYPYNINKAKQLVQQSGTKGMKVTVYTISDVAVDKATGEYLQGQLKKIGWNAQIRELAGANYFTIIGNQATKAQIGFTDWFEDYPYPTDWFNILENGNNITQVHNNNYSNVNFNDTNKTINQLTHLQPSQALSKTTNDNWANLDKRLMVHYASEAPYLNGIVTSFFSSKMALPCDVFDDNFDDLAQFCLNYRSPPGRGGVVHTAAPARPLDYAHDAAVATTGQEEFSLDTASELAAEESGARIEGRSPWVLAGRRLRRNKFALFFLGVFLLILLACIFGRGLYAHHVSGMGENDTNPGGVITVNGKPVHVISQGKTTIVNGVPKIIFGGVPIGPQWTAAGGQYVLGADTLGRDVATRVLYGGYNSLFIGIISAVICTVLSVMFALLAGYFGGVSDWIISRAFDLIWAFPVILLGIALGTALSLNGFHHGPISISGSSLWIPIAVISIVFVPYIGRPLRGQVLALRQREFIEASTAQGAGPLRIMFTELLPNLASSVLVLFTLIVANAILTEAALSFLGAGVQPPNPSWGTMIADGQHQLANAPWISLFPGIMIALTVLSLNVFGDGLRDALDPRAKVRIEH